MYNRRYDKHFVMMRQEVSGFSMGQRPAWGSCIMEIKNNKGRITATIQGLKKLNDNREYTLYVIGGKGGKAGGISCGIMEVDQFGKGELRWDFDPDNICGTGLTVEELHTVAIFAGEQQKYGLTAPVVGYFAEKVNWKGNFQELAKKIPSASEPNRAIQPKSEKPAAPVKERKTFSEVAIKEQTLVAAEAAVVEEVKEVKEVNEESTQVHTNEAVAPAMAETVLPRKEPRSNFQENFKNMLMQFQKELSNLEKHGVLTPKDMEKINAAAQVPQVSASDAEVPKSQESPVEVATSQVSPVKEKEEVLEKKQEILSDMEYIFQKNDAILPFEEDDFLWRCISMEELAVLPMKYIPFMRDIFFIYSYRKYKHFILGRNKEGKISLGLPSHYNPKDEKWAKQLGFYTFKPCGNEKMKQDCHGYWIMEVKK
jgi:hypothetical protein